MPSCSMSRGPRWEDHVDLLRPMADEEYTGRTTTLSVIEDAEHELMKRERAREENVMQAREASNTGPRPRRHSPAPHQGPARRRVPARSQSPKLQRADANVHQHTASKTVDTASSGCAFTIPLRVTMNQGCCERRTCQCCCDATNSSAPRCVGCIHKCC